ncbi:MAG TPA: type II toxin-antitoxin system Phd/YefM family antitoxin [Alphaproteobacteria bacterium]|nr:type II toxin-antitoxin system Phd/YefM family antitoxin [Alphaproteobacteria bacterium]
MKSWSVQEAKARFSEFLATCLRNGPQLVTKRGAETAVLVPVEEWRRLRQSTRRTLKELLLAEAPRADIPTPRRGRRRRREAPRLD